MRKRSLQILGVALVVGAAAWALMSPSSATTDEARYKQWHRSFEQLVFLERHLPTSLSKALDLPARERRCLEKDDEQIYQVLHASGYLTNVYIAVTNAGASRNQIMNRLDKATQGSSAKWEFYVRSNAVVVLTCRPQDVALCARAVENR